MLIKITRSPYSKGNTLDVNGQRANVPPAGESADIPAELLPALADSHIEYEIVGAADEAGAGAEGDQGDAPAETALEPEPPAEEEEQSPDVNDEATAPEIAVDLSILDGSVPSILSRLPDLSDADVANLLEAEKAGKTRATLIPALEERLNPPQE